MSKGLSRDLGDVLVLPLPFLGVLQTKSVAKDLSDGLEGYPLDIRVAEDNEYPTEEADTAVEAESARWRHSLHHGQKGGGDDDIGSPADNGVLGSYHYKAFHISVGKATYQHGTKSSDFHWDDLSSDPGNSGNTG